MSQRDIYEALEKTLGLLHVIKTITQRLKALFSGSHDATLQGVNTLLVERIMADLEDMTANAWPEAVYAMGSDELPV